MRKKQFSPQSLLYLATYASSSVEEKSKNNSQEAYLDTGLYTGRPCIGKISRPLKSLLIKIIMIHIPLHVIT